MCLCAWVKVEDTVLLSFIGVAVEDGPELPDVTT